MKRVQLTVGIFAATAFLAGCGAPTFDTNEASFQASHPFPTRETTSGIHAHPVHGVDVAKYQGTIDWHQLRQAGVRFAFIKATEGADRLDDRFHQNWEAARAAGIARGAYHFNYWCSPIEDQIAWYKRHVPVERDAMPPILDLEWNRHSPTCPQKFPKEVIIPRIRKWLVEMERHYGKKPIIYVDGPFYKDILADGEFSEYPMWLSNMRGLPQEKFPGRRWAFWQYTFRGRLPGVRGYVDRNVFAGTLSQWQALAESGFSSPGKRIDSPLSDEPEKAPAAPDATSPTLVATLPKEAPLPPPRPESAPQLAEATQNEGQKREATNPDDLPPAPEPKREGFSLRNFLRLPGFGD